MVIRQFRVTPTERITMLAIESASGSDGGWWWPSIAETLLVDLQGAHKCVPFAFTMYSMHNVPWCPGTYGRHHHPYMALR